MRRRWEAADTVVAISTALLIIVFGILAALVWRGIGVTIAEAEQQAQVAADAAADKTRWFLAERLLRLDVLATGDDVASTIPLSGQAGAGLPAPTPGLYGPDGSLLAPTAGARLPESIAGESFFTAVAAGRSFALGRAAALGGEEALPTAMIARRIEREGAFAGVAAMSISAPRLRGLVIQDNIMPGATGLLAYAGGQVIAAYGPDGRPVQLPELTLPEGESGSFELVAEAGPAIGAFRRIPELGLVTLVTVQRASVFAPLRQATLIVLALMGPFAVGMFAASLLVARLLRRSERSRRELALALEQNKLLFREIHHRVKNNLQSIASLLQLQPIPSEVKAEMGQRIAAMSAVHEQIYRSDDFRRVRMKEYIQTLLAGIGAGHDPAVVLRQDVEDVFVDRDAATPLGLIINEVIANAYKHAFPSGGGTITVGLRQDDEGQGVLTVADDGVGYDPARPSRGIGRRLVEALTAQIGGRSSFESGTGSRFTLTFPLAV
jgi:two-component sensor histidine kinase